MSRDSIREGLLGLDTNFVGQEGRGAASETVRNALAVVERVWAEEDAAEARRRTLIAALRAEAQKVAAGIPGLNAPDLVADHMAGGLSMFVLSLDDRTWRAAEGGTPDGR